MPDPYVPPPVKPSRPFWAKPFAPPPVRQLIAWLSALLLVLSALFGLCTLEKSNFEESSATVETLSTTGKQKAALLLFWVLVPPVWFWFEYFFLYRYDPLTLPNGDAKPDWDNFKYGQDLSAKIWLALVTALTILYFGKDIKG
jgi:hypothetical protein